jgi:hypothetical protein
MAAEYTYDREAKSVSNPPTGWAKNGFRCPIRRVPHEAVVDDVSS